MPLSITCTSVTERIGRRRHPRLPPLLHIPPPPPILFTEIQGDTKKRELLKCVVAAITVGSTAEQGPRATDNLAI